MGFLDSLLSGVMAVLGKGLEFVGRAVGVVLRELDNSAIGQAVTGLAKSLTPEYRRAEDLAAREREIAERAARDGRTHSRDQDELAEINRARDELRRQMEAKQAANRREEFHEAAQRGDLYHGEFTHEAGSYAVGVLASKKCPVCKAEMRIRQSGADPSSGERRFYWQCTDFKGGQPCPTVKFQPDAHDVLMEKNPDLEGSYAERHQIFTRTDVLRNTHQRLRQHLGDDDEKVLCPKHLLPMKLMPKRLAGQRLLDSYEYVCLAVGNDGLACEHSIKLETFPQVAATLRRTEGVGILDA
jgi:hypothetical protein